MLFIHKKPSTITSAATTVTTVLWVGKFCS